MSQDQPTSPESTESTRPMPDRPRRRPRPSASTPPPQATQPADPSPETARDRRRRERLEATEATTQAPSEQPSTARQDQTPVANQRPQAQRPQATSPVDNPNIQDKAPTPKSAANQVLGTVTQVLQSVLDVVAKPLLGSKLYTQNKAKIEAGWRNVQPLVKVLQWLWNQLLKPLWNRVLQPLWSRVLGLLRPRLPQPLKTLSDQILTAVVLGPLILLWWLISALTSGHQVAQVPSAPPVVSRPQPSVSAPKPPISAPVAEAPELPVPPVAEPEPEPEEPPKEVLSVQRQVAQISDRYPDIVPSIQADFEASRLVVKVSDRWYDLSNTEQDTIGLDILKRSGDLEFEALELRDGQGQLVARDPVVGPNIIVLQRHHQA
jgi:hypothetical protein